MILSVLTVFAVVGFFVFSQKNIGELSNEESSVENINENSSNNVVENNSPQTEEAIWSFNFDNQEWEVLGNPPECPNPLLINSPVDVSLASSILYPGQVRGGDYKPHGGFRFDGLENNEVDVYAPINASIFKAARHLESGEVQYVLYLINDCGIMYKLDHLRELTPKFEDILNKIPMGEEGDSRTTEINPRIFVEEGEHIAVKVGIESNKNVFFDFGLYDLRKKNGVNYDSEFRSKYQGVEEYSVHALCWLDNLNEPDKTIVKNLSGADGVSGKESDYC